MHNPGALEELLRRDRLLVGLCLLFITCLAGAYILSGAGMEMSAWQMSQPMRRMGAMDFPPWSTTHALVMFLMWWVMMIAMMLPSATPTILLAAALNRRSQSEMPPYGSTGLFCLGYLLAWAAFSLLAVLTQWGLERGAMLSMHLETVPTSLTGGLLVTAGVWQLTPMKAACLRHCRSPADFLVQHRRAGPWGALWMGVHHGLYCLGCCWALMALLFVGGVMNIAWIVGLAAFVIAEKRWAAGPQLGRLAGLCLLLAGVFLLVS